MSTPTDSVVGKRRAPRGEASPDPEEAGRPAPRLLCTNDDGVHARGLELLAQVAGRVGRVHLVAPDRQQSASSHSLTLHRPLRVTRTATDRFVVDGTPTDCVMLAVNMLLEERPDFVLSGVNHGPNMGEDVLYSGTVAAAMEGTILGIPSAAISFAGEDDRLLEGYGPLLEQLLARIVAQDFPEETFFNVNLPDRPAEEVEGIRLTSLGRRVYSDSLTRSRDPRGREYYWIGGGETHWSGREDSDYRAVRAGYVSVTPLHLDLTDFRLMDELAAWSLDG